MKDDPLRRDLHSELRQIRRGPGEFRLERITTAEAVTDAVGEGSVERAYTTLLDVMVRHGADEEGDVRAYFETCGFNTSGDSLNARLQEYAGRHHVDERTALRRSDRGADRLSYILRDIVNYERPWGNIAIAQRDTTVNATVWVELPSHAMWRRPHVYINGDFQEGREFELHDSETHESLVSGKEEFRNLTFNHADEDEHLFRIAVYWAMPVWPIWQTGAHLEDPSLQVRMVNDRTLSAEVTIWRSVQYLGLSGK